MLTSRSEACAESRSGSTCKRHGLLQWWWVPPLLELEHFGITPGLRTNVALDKVWVMCPFSSQMLAITSYIYSPLLELQLAGTITRKFRVEDHIFGGAKKTHAKYRNSFTGDHRSLLMDFNNPTNHNEGFSIWGTPKMVGELLNAGWGYHYELKNTHIVACPLLLVSFPYWPQVNPLWNQIISSRLVCAPPFQ